MHANNYYTDRHYENNNIPYMNNLDRDGLPPRNNTQNFFPNNNPNYLNENENYYFNSNNNLNVLNNNSNNNFIHMNQNLNEFNNDVNLFKNRINKLQRKVGRLNKFRNEINEAISYNMDGNNNYLNKTQNYYDNNESDYFEENKQNLNINKSFDVLKMNYDNYDFVFDSGNGEDLEGDNNIDDNYMKPEEEQLDNEDININLQNDMNMDYGVQNKDNSFIGFYDNIFSSKNVEIEEEKNNNINNNFQNNINIDKNDNDDINDGKIFDYKNIQLFEENYQFNIPKVEKVSSLNDKDEIKKLNNIQVVSNELSILTNGQKEKIKGLNNDINVMKNDDNVEIIEDIKNNNISKEKDKTINLLEEKKQKELQKYDMIIAQAKELNNQFILGQNEYEKKDSISKDKTEILNTKKDEKEKLIEKEKKKEELNIVKEDLIILNKKNNVEKIKIKKPKHVSFIEDKIYMKYEQDDYILKLNVFNNKKEKINFITHDLKKYLQRLKKIEYLEPAIINCPNINYKEINNKAINLLKKEKNIQKQAPKIDNRINKSVKNPRPKMPINRNPNKKQSKNTLNVDKIRVKPANNNIKVYKSNNMEKTKKEKIIKSIPHNNLNKEKNSRQFKEDKLIKKNKDNKNEKNVIKKLDIFDNPIFQEGQKAINNLKKFFEENNLD